MNIKNNISVALLKQRHKIVLEDETFKETFANALHFLLSVITLKHMQCQLVKTRLKT